VQKSFCVPSEAPTSESTLNELQELLAKSKLARSSVRMK
jgi:hypothetical protein